MPANLEPHPLPITDDDVRAIVCLLGEVAGLDAPVGERRRALITGLARLVNADVWVWVHSGGLDGRGQPTVLGVIDGGWLDDAERTRMYHANTQPEFAALWAGGYVPNRAVTFVVDESLPSWDQGVFDRVVVSTGLTRILLSFRPLGDGFISGIGLHRRAGRDAYTPREVAIVSLVLGQIDWLHHYEPPPAAKTDDVFQLSPRLRETLLHLLGGDSRKQIARKLGVSQHTVDDYVKELHRRLGVSSRGELMAKFLSVRDD